MPTTNISGNQLFYASELEYLNMSGMNADCIQHSSINKYGQMVYNINSKQSIG